MRLIEVIKGNKEGLPWLVEEDDYYDAMVVDLELELLEKKAVVAARFEAEVEKAEMVRLLDEWD